MHLAGAILATPVGVEDTAGDVTVAAGDGHLDRGDHHRGFHAVIDGPPHDPVREYACDRTQLQLALGGLVLGDV